MLFFFSSRRRHTRWPRDWSSDVCSSDLSSKIRSNRIRHCRPSAGCRSRPRPHSALHRAFDGAPAAPLVLSYLSSPFLLVHTARSEEHTSELQSRGHIVCRLLLEKKKTTN